MAFYFLLGYTVAILYIKLEQHNMIEYLNSFKIFNYTVCFICYVMLIDGLRFGYIHSYFVKHNYGIDLKVGCVLVVLFIFNADRRAKSFNKMFE